MKNKKTKKILIAAVVFFALIFIVFLIYRPSEKERIETILPQAEEAYKNKDYSGALELYNQYVDSLGKEQVAPEIYDKMGVCSYNLSDLDQAIEYYSDSLAKVDNVKVKISLANTYRDKGETDQAIEIYKQIIVDNPDYKYIPLYENLLQALLQKKDYDEVVEYGNKFLGFDGDYENLEDENIQLSVLLNLAKAYKNNGNNQKYQEIVNRLEKYNPDLIKNIESGYYDE